MNKTYDDFLNDLGNRESSGNYGAENTIGFIGKYQWGEGMLQDLGYYKADETGWRKNDWIGEWTGKDGIYSKEDFLNNPSVQEKAIKEEMDLLNKRINNAGFDDYIGRNINDVKITRSGLLAGAHLKGTEKGGLRTFLHNKTDNSDKYGTKISEYINKFKGYQTPFDKIGKFIWHCESEETKPCDDCLARDGKIFTYGEDIEPPLHPNCDCWIEDYDGTNPDGNRFGENDEEQENEESGEERENGGNNEEQESGENDENDNQNEDEEMDKEKAREMVEELEKQLADLKAYLKNIENLYKVYGSQDLKNKINELRVLIMSIEEEIDDLNSFINGEEDYESDEYKGIRLSLEFKSAVRKLTKINLEEFYYSKKFVLYLKKGIDFL